MYFGNILVGIWEKVYWAYLIYHGENSDGESPEYIFKISHSQYTCMRVFKSVKE